MHTDQQNLDLGFPLHLADTGVPIYVQIREQLLQAIGAGKLQPGEQMPTMRQVANVLKVDLNTVRHAYSELERTGAITIVPARGTYVAEQPPKLDPAAKAERTRSLARRTVAAAAAMGIDPLDLADRIIRIAQGKGD